jgi:hypothetical protein
MKRQFTLIATVAYMAAISSSAAMRSTPIIAKFGGECEGTAFQPTPQLASLIRAVKRHQDNACTSPSATAHLLTT